MLFAMAAVHALPPEDEARKAAVVKALEAIKIVIPGLMRDMLDTAAAVAVGTNRLDRAWQRAP